MSHEEALLDIMEITAVQEKSINNLIEAANQLAGFIEVILADQQLLEARVQMLEAADDE